MELKEGLLTRRSVRKYSDKPISKADLKEIIRITQYAPSAHNTKPWEFLVIEDKEVLGKFRNLQRAAAFAANAQAVILVCVDETRSLAREKEGWTYADIDGSSATAALLMAAHSLGIGSCWCGCSPMTKPVEDVKEFFKLPSNIRPFSIVTLGYAETQPRQPEDREDETKIHWEKW